ncbi:MAG: aldo/keto reductase [Planctomycetes bacterium]|nr:aldo/keto reductase [Planctomycetota bacterium]
MPRRPFGETGIELSIIGFGGIVVMKAEQNHANKLVAEAVERGVNYFDVAPTYGDAELKLGPALLPYRKNVFLACKTTERKRDAAESELKRSLERLRTDYLDLYQLHALEDLKTDVDVVFGPGGAMETFLAAKKAGVVRHLGFSAHSVEAALAAMDRYDFDSVLFPINFACFHAGDFGPQVIAKAKSKNIARLALKAMAQCPWPDKNAPERARFAKCWYRPLIDPAQAALGLRFTLSQPITAAVSPGEETLFRLALDLAMDFKPLTPSEENQVKTWAKKVAPIFSYKGRQEAKP